MTTKTEDPIEFMFEYAKVKGIAVSTVKDGHIMVLDRKWMETVVERLKAEGRDDIVVFVQRVGDGN